MTGAGWVARGTRPGGKSLRGGARTLTAASADRLNAGPERSATAGAPGRRIPYASSFVASAAVASS